MATNFGFMPVLTGKRYFISYKSEDSERVGEITRRLNQMGVPMWYDYGIEKGELWEKEINQNIKASEAVIIFATKNLFSANDTWVRIEFDVAKMYGKKRYVVWLDDLDPYEHPEDVHDDLKIWYWNVARLQGIKVAGQNADQIAWSTVTEFKLMKGMAPQPPSPTYPPPVYQPLSQPAQKTHPTKHTPRMNVRVGDRIPFGQYPQGANGEIQPLEWRVLAVESGRVLLITDKLIDARPYNEIFTFVTWEECSLRQWLIQDFIYNAFSAKERAKIALTTNNNPNNLKFGTKGGKQTKDIVFVLSIEEANIYFQNDKDRMSYLTSYAISRIQTNGKKISQQNEKMGWWWLRSSGRYSLYAANVRNYGYVNQTGNRVDNHLVAVRPVLWLNI